MTTPSSALVPESQFVRWPYQSAQRAEPAAILFVLGLILAFNPILMMIAGFELRASDVLVPTLSALLFFQGRAEPALKQMPYALIVLASCLGAIYFVLETYDAHTAAFLGRFLLYGAAAPLMSHVIVRDGVISRFFRTGVIVGLCVNAILLLLQRKAPGVLEGLGVVADPEAFKGWVNGTLRSSGLWGHPNEAMAVVTIFCGIGLGGDALRRENWLSLGLIAIVLTAAAYCTLTRSGLLVITAALVAQAFRRGPGAIMLLAALGVMALALVPAFAPWLIDKIELRSAGMFDNLSERLRTTLSAAEYAFNHPFGSRIVDLGDEMERSVGIAATHNSLLFMTAILGLPAGALIIGRLLTQATAPFGRDIAVLALVIMLQFMFEEAILGPSIMFAFFLALNADAPRAAPRAATRIISLQALRKLQSRSATSVNAARAEQP